ncbi:MAG: GGDEF domain-containing protein [Marinomonas foliarum]|jgi:diguanylate cyclase (GGDEF)-like protein|uniref:diguanylate cyclase n=1 Tax=Marinomonas foliarum TaxID=491950 RepID=A0A369ACU1_9GAMM|nr:GGDEF domain-containing protein [Marinomonas foliarum]RCX06945.1 diguanylate cyclase (GGDEF)-like protein [Marinomonas foliarum]
MFTWLNASMTRKISGLSFVLLAFLFIVILYTAYKSQKIYKDIQEVSKIDIPLLEVIADIEILQLKQHLWMEGIRLQGDVFFEDENLRKKGMQGFDQFNQRLATQLERAISILHSALALDSVRINVADHQVLLKKIKDLHSHRVSFEHAFVQFINKDQHSDIDWNNVEKQDNALDDEANELLMSIDQLAIQVASSVEKQERDFLVMSATLGFVAFVIGIYLTLHTILSFRRKVDVLRGQIDSLHRSMPHDADANTPRYKGTDELDELEKDLRILIGRFSQERESRDEVESKLIELATRDKLTGAFNRHKWDEQIKYELVLAQSGHHFSLILLDVDYFKKINDSYGHDVGDNVLRVLVKTLHRRLRQTDALFRVGGEEFAILLKDTNLEEAEFLADQLRKSIESLNDPDIPSFTISLGVTEYQHLDDQSRMIKRTDILLYEAKGAGRNRIMVG